MRLTTVLALAGVLCLAAQLPAAVIYETDFVTRTDSSPFNAALLQFQDGWLGQNNATVDPSGSGVINANGAFFRNLNNRGALGTQAGGGGGEGTGPGFNVGDKLQIEMTYQFDLDSRLNRPLNRTGVRECFTTCGFDAAPKIGLKSFYSEFQASSGGALKLFGSVNRNGFSGADNAFALITSGLSIGLDPDGVTGPADLSSDLLGYSLELTYLGADQWQTSALTLTNETTGGGVLLDAATDQPAILTEVQTIAATDLYFASTWTDSGINVSSDSVRYSYTAVPEPTAFALFGLALAGVAARSRR